MSDLDRQAAASLQSPFIARGIAAKGEWVDNHPHWAHAFRQPPTTVCVVDPGDWDLGLADLEEFGQVTVHRGEQWTTALAEHGVEGIQFQIPTSVLDASEPKEVAG